MIKCRAWDTTRKKMWSAEEMGADELTLNPDGRGFVNVNGDHPSLSQYLPHLIPLLWTEDVDRNGKEVYQADILLIHTADCDYRAVVEWIHDDRIGFELRPIGLPPDLEREEWREVIGDIYRNPELLKAKCSHCHPEDLAV